METTGFSMLLMMLFSFGTANELLDFMHTPSYWQLHDTPMTVERMIAEFDAPAVVDTEEIPKWIAALGADHFRMRKDASKALQEIGEPARPFLEAASTSEDPEISSRARSLLASLPSRQPSTAIRRLMAVRTLGELKDPKGLAVLESLLDSNEPFLADFARLAAQRIEGKPHEHVPLKHNPADLALLPSNTAALGQMVVPGDPDWHVEKLFEHMPMFGAVEGQADMLAEMTEAVGLAAEQLGNVRLDALTLGFTENIARGDGAMILIAHGKWDVRKMTAGLKQMAPDWPQQNVDDQTVIVIESNVRLIAFDDATLAFVAATDEAGQMVRKLIQAKKQPVDLALDAGLIQELSGMDRAQPSWLIADLKKAAPDLDGPFKSLEHLSLTTRSVDQKSILHFTVRGRPGATVALVQEVLQGKVKEMIAQVEQGATFLPKGEQTIKMLKSLKLERGAQGLSGQFELDKQAGTSLFMPLLMFGRMPLQQLE
jgi:hypothetical protein